MGLQSYEGDGAGQAQASAKTVPLRGGAES